MPRRQHPNVPRELADGLFSLHVGRSTPALSIHMTLGPDGNLHECGVELSTICTTKKLTYTEVDELLDQTMPEQDPAIWALHKVASNLTLQASVFETKWD